MAVSLLVAYAFVQQSTQHTLLACLALFLCHGYSLFSAQTFDDLPRAHANLIGPSMYKVDYYSKKKERKKSKAREKKKKLKNVGICLLPPNTILFLLKFYVSCSPWSGLSNRIAYGHWCHKNGSLFWLFLWITRPTPISRVRDIKNWIDLTPYCIFLINMTE